VSENPAIARKIVSKRGAARLRMGGFWRPIMKR
jgi:hypothetical protein